MHDEVRLAIEAITDQKGAASGIASLDVTTLVPTVQLGGAGADATKFLRGDQTWAVPSGGTPAAHAASHQDTGTDEISVAGLSGALADKQDANKLQGYAVELAAPENGEILIYDGVTSQWRPDTHWVPGHKASHQDTGGDEISLAGLDGEPSTLTTHKGQEPHNAHANNPACDVYHLAAQSIPNTAWTAVTFDSETADTDAMHEGVTNPTRITFQTAGTYLVTAYAAFASSGTGSRGLMFQRGGIYNAGRVYIPTVAYPEEPGLCVTQLESYSAGDYVQLLTYQNSGGALNLQAYPHFSAVRVG